MDGIDEMREGSFAPQVAPEPLFGLGQPGPESGTAVDDVDCAAVQEAAPEGAAPDEPEEQAGHVLDGEAAPEGSAPDEPEPPLRDPLQESCDADSPAEGAASGQLEADGGIDAEGGLDGEGAEGLAAIEARLNELTSKVDRLAGLIEHDLYLKEVLKKQSDEVQEARNDLYGQLTLPLLKDFIQMREGLSQSIQRALRSGDENPSVPVATIEAYRDDVESILEDNGVTLVRVEPGSEFNPKIEKTAGKVPTGDESLHGAVESVKSIAYLRDGKAIVPARVKLYVYDRELGHDAGAEKAAEADGQGQEAAAAATSEKE